VNDPMQAQLDQFARELAALNAKFEALQRRMSTAPQEAPAPRRPIDVPPWLQRLDELFASGAHDEALRMVEWNLEQRFDEYSARQLEQLLTYLRAVDTPERERRDALIALLERGPRVTPEPAPVVHRPTYEPVSAPRPPRAPRPRPQLPTIEIDLLGPRALAVAGGIVTLLGIVFFFVLAVKHGWVGPRTRVSLGGIAAALVFSAGLELKRRYGTTHSTLAAIGAGIAGAYATLLSAAALYHMISDWTALLAAGAIAAVGLATSLRWRSDIVAGIGLLGAMLVPATIELQGGTSVLATSFVAIVFAVLAAVCIGMHWRILLVAGWLGSVPQLLALVLAPRYAHQSPASVIAVVAVFFVLHAATGVARQLRATPGSVDGFATPFILVAGLIAGGSLARLLATNDQRGVALMILAGAYVVPGAFFFTREKTRDLSAILTFATFTLMAIGFSLLLEGNALVYAWAAEAIGLAWLARTVREIRFQVWSAVYLILALVHVLALDAPLRDLFTAVPHPAVGAPAAAALAAAAGVFAFYAGPWEREEQEKTGLAAALAALLDAWAAAGPRFRVATAWAALAFATYAASLGTVALFSQFHAPYGWGWVAVSGLFMGVGLGALALALRRVPQAELGALLWLGTSAATLAARAAFLAPAPRAWSLVIVAVGLFAASVAYQLVPREARPEQRDVSALAAIAAVVFSLVGAAALLSGEPLAYAWAGEALVLVALGRLLAAQHLRTLALAPLACAVIHSLAIDAPPMQLLHAVDHPAHGAMTAVATGAAALLMSLIPAGERRTYGALAPVMHVLESAARPLNDALRWLAGAFGTYALSLAVLWAMPSFDWAYVVLAGIWMTIGLAITGAGFLRNRAQLRLGALVWIAATGCIALREAVRMFDGNPRAFVFVAVGLAVLVVSMAFGLSRRVAASGISAGSVLVSLVLLAYPVVYRLDDRWEGAALLGLAALYAALSAVLFRQRLRRDVTTLYWALAVCVAAFADIELLHATYSVLGWAVAGVAVAWLAVRVKEPRLHAGALVFVALATGRAFIFQAPPNHLFSRLPNPAYGSASIFIAALAVAGLSFLARAELVRLGKLRTSPWWLAGGLAVYGVSLVILQLVEWLSSAPTLDTEFQRGHTAVSAFWGLLALALLYAGLKRRRRMLRVAGLAFFPVILAKIFFFDLPSLSSVTRALSFLAVGAVLLLGGFFYQRFVSERDETPQPQA
jgi:hypothetical protein